jgi:DNA-binding response OmpR family regulator
MRSSEIQARTKGDRGKRKPLPQKYVRMRPAGTDRQAKRILVVDDEPQIVEIVERYLSDEGFRVSHAYDGAEAIKIVDEEPPDLIVLDLKMPVVNGSEALREIRSRSGVPIIMLTSRTDEVDRIVGLELGADDYINKPFSPREVVARVKAVLRRSHPDEMRASASGNAAGHTAQPQPVRLGELEIDAREHEVRLRGKPVQLTPTEFRILEILAGSPGQTYTRAQLLDLIRGDDFEIFDRTLDRHVANLRNKIEHDAGAPRYILTVFGVGYKLAKKP